MNTKYRLCPSTNKRCMTKSEAKAAAAALRRKAFFLSERTTTAYRCPDWESHAKDGHWHIGRRTQRSIR